MKKNREIYPYIAHQRKADGAIQSLEVHLLEVASLARLFASKIGLGRQAELAGLLHDLGKYSKEFQIYIQSAVGLLNPDEDEEFVDAHGLKGKVDHSTAGAQLVWQQLSKRGPLGNVVGQILALCIASHHSGLIDCLSSDTGSLGKDLFTKRIGKLENRSHVQEAIANMDSAITDGFQEMINDPSLIDGLKKAIGDLMSVDVGKGADPRNNIVIQFKIGLLVRFLFSCLIDADRISSADFEKPKAAQMRLRGRYCEWPILIERLEEHLKALPLRYPIDEHRRNR